MFRFSIRDVLWLTVVVAVNVVVACFFYETAGWYYIRGYQEVVTDFIYPPIILQALVNLIMAAIYGVKAARQQSQRQFVVSIAFFACSIIVAGSLYPAPTVGKWLTRHLLLPTPLIEAARYGDAPVVIALVNHGVDPNIRHVALRTTPLHCMASYDKPDAIELLLKHGADPKARDGFGKTPLHDATFYRAHLPTMKLLVDAGADPFATDSQGHTPVTDVYSWAPEYPGRKQILILFGLTFDDGDSTGHTLATREQRQRLKTLIRGQQP